MLRILLLHDYPTSVGLKLWEEDSKVQGTMIYQEYVIGVAPPRVQQSSWSRLPQAFYDIGCICR